MTPAGTLYPADSRTLPTMAGRVLLSADHGPTEEVLPVSEGDGHRQRRLARSISLAGLAAGLTLLARPAEVAAAIAPAFPRERLWVARLLGARLAAQHAAVLMAPRAPVLEAAAAVDALHAASMLPVLALPRYRRAALVSGTLAAASAVVGRPPRRSR